MSHFYDLAAHRRSMRRFTAERLTQDEWAALMGTALMSPSSKGTCCWQFVVVEDPELLRQLAQCKEHGSAFMADAPAAVVVLADPSVSDVWVEDASVATTYLLLQAEDCGLGACWVQVRRRETADGTSAEDVVRRILGIPGHLRVLSLVALGHKAMERKPFQPENLKWDKVHLNVYPTSSQE